jgi:lactoylglutathione lyase
VSDLDQSTSFYERLGLKRIADPFNDSRHAFFSMGRQQQLHLIAGGHKIDGADIDVHLAFRVHSIPELVKNLDALGIRYYNTKHVPRGITTRPDGVQQIYLQDPDGYWLEFNDASP